MSSLNGFLFISGTIVFQLMFGMTTSALIHLKADKLETVISPEQCWQLYPFTYSKCLKICSSSENATCLDDQLCYCKSLFDGLGNNISNFNIKDDQGKDIVSNVNTQFSVNSLASCHFSDFCEELCRNDEKLSTINQRNTVYGALCKLSEYFDENGRSFYEDVDSCVCTIS